MPLALSLLLVAVFLAMNAFFVVAEFAMVRVRPSQIEMAYGQKRPGAAAAKVVTENVNAYLSACQLGITLASLALGFLGEPAFAALIGPLFHALGLPEAAVGPAAIAVGYVLMTSLHVVVGELIPKSFAIFSSERFALMTAPPLRVFYLITYPLMWLFNSLTNVVMRLAGHEAASDHEVYTGEEIKLLIDESTESGLIDPESNTIVDNVFDIAEKDAEGIMTPRTDVICLDLEDSLAENLQVARNYKYTRYPVCRGDKDRIVGFIHVKDLYTAPAGTPLDEMRIRPIEAVPEGTPVSRILQMLQQNSAKMVVVVDEHGGTSGIVTLADIMEQIVGRMHDEYQHGDDGHVELLADGARVIDGLRPIDETVELLGFRPNEAADCETAAGLLLALLGRIPDEGDEAELRGPDVLVRFTVMAMDGLRIDRIRVETEPIATGEGDAVEPAGA
ncbi:HlyC/CorC family transporter [Eggerthellaceae bacterium zg-1084]|uniref:HlyC/CorC family transporter n=1 Tax=Berryella wangjianweii TaxID=2734634 RepID=A0A6M8J1V9_9ACTN|nr:hemolysin family protein [Berryella wangjianweii]NPD30986.1 HlyC/CorC family transporter [Berryella wangjianweii]NPD31851.1 HlyC/CorC family transporter [Eggerthellaceae bacterium zg-997]QKF07554.1 HlyC/CorC family transporter [Berryella wangjianweii]